MRARAVIGADGARSQVARDTIKAAAVCRSSSPTTRSSARRRRRQISTATRCDVFYQGRLSPDFYGWVFPHGDTTSVGVGSARKGFSLRGAVKALRAATALKDCETIRTEGAPIPLRPLKRWDNGRDVVLAGDAAGVVAPASGEGIYYAMVGGRCTPPRRSTRSWKRGMPAPSLRRASVHARARDGVLGAGDHAAFLVP
jgi:geranylgeranyl reductase